MSVNWIPINLRRGKWALAALLAASALLAHLVAAQEQRWPTPPPAPPAAPPRIETSITPVDPPAVAGAIRWEVQPRPLSFIPAIPPLGSDSFTSPDGLTVAIDAGSLERTIQLVYAPVPAGEVSIDPLRQRLIAAFDLKTYDAAGKEAQPRLRRAWTLTAPVSRLPGPTGDPARLMLARWDGAKWVPQVTSFYRDTNTLSALLLNPGRYAIIAELRPN